MKQLEHRHILEALDELSRRLGARDVRGEVCLFGGAAMILAFQTRQATKDIDAIFAPVSLVRELAEEIGRERDFQEGILPRTQYFIESLFEELEKQP